MFFSKKFIKILSILFLLSFFLLVLIQPKECRVYASYGLMLWFDKMIPTLYPFMVLSQIMLQSGIAFYLSNILYFFIGRIYSISVYALFVIIMGFLSGFPMGAILISSLLQKKYISKEEGEYLLAFCNNLGPVFVIGFVYPLCPILSIQQILFVVYGIPLIFGLFLRYTKYRHLQFHTPNACKHTCNFSFINILENVLNPCLISIARLGGLMILFNSFQVYFSNNLYQINGKVHAILSLLLEITGGIEIASSFPELFPFVYVLLPFGGLCCLAQTSIIMKKHDFSIALYLLNKGIQCIASALFLLFFYSIS